MSFDNISRSEQAPNTGEEPTQADQQQNLSIKAISNLDEVATIKSSLQDQDFNIKDYPDPLLPCKGSPSQYFPNGITADMEKHWLLKIEEWRKRQ